jgi:hypothetical protein
LLSHTGTRERERERQHEGGDSKCSTHGYSFAESKTTRLAG